MRFLLSVLLLVTVTFSQAEIVTVPIPGAPGLSVTVGTGANALPLQEIKNNPNAVNITTWDDNITEVPLGFNFPFFGQTFTNSWAATNGFVTFQDPWQSGLGGGCCSGVDLRNTTNPAYNYTIFGVHTDLYSWNGQNQYYLREPNQMTYGWYGVSQCCSAEGGNSFEIKINSAGVVDTRIAGAMVQWNAVTSGMSGDLSRGEYYQYYHGQGLQINTTTGAVSWNTSGGFTGSDPCISNPLSSPTCSGYAAAYLTQQCTISPLYNTSCPGYSQAYFTQQCSLNPLYNSQCPGYANAYFDQQCSMDPLYNVNCPGYANAYLNYQCSINPLYSTTCTGYADAYLSQQCSLNPLYSTTCSGYETAYFNQQCTINGLYSNRCPNYQQAYFADQCTKNGLYSKDCPNYATAYATWLALQPVQSTTTTSPTATTSQTTTSTPTVESSGELKIAVVADQNVNNVITTTATSASPAQAATATVPLVSTTNTAAETKVVAAVQTKTEEKKDASSSNTSSSSSTSGTTAQTTSDDKKSDQPKTARQELQERRVAAAKAKAVEDGKNLANNMGKVADMEQQKAVQNVVIAAMGFTPGFDAYGKVTLPDVRGYKPFTVYNNQVNVDNRRLGRGLFGPTDNLHREMVEAQYR